LAAVRPEEKNRGKEEIQKLRATLSTPPRNLTKGKVSTLERGDRDVQGKAARERGRGYKTQKVKRKTTFNLGEKQKRRRGNKRGEVD